jgi:hypothetical protein
LDEDEDSAVVEVAPGVSFIATANIGNEYTATRVLDKASARRFPIKLEMPPLNAKELKKLFSLRFPDRTPIQVSLMDTLTEISDDIMAQCKLEESSISTFIPPANMVEMAELVMDGFTLEEIAEAAIYTEYPDDSEADSERTSVKGIIQKYIVSNAKSPIKDPLKGKNVKKFP